MTTNPTPAPLSPEREAEIRAWRDEIGRIADNGMKFGELAILTDLLDELDRARAERDELKKQRDLARGMARQLLAKVTAARIERDELQKRIAELERPAVEAKRAEIRSSYSELIAQCEQDRDYEGAIVVGCRLREREEQWKREDEEAGR